MRIFAGDTELFAQSVTVSESLFDYCATLVFTLSYPMIYDKVSLEVVGQYEFVPVAVERVNVQEYQYTCYPKAYMDFLQRVTTPINLTGTLQEVLEALAVCEFEVVNKTQKVHYVLPSMGGKTLIDTLIAESCAVNGGCPTIHFGLNGTMYFIDVLAQQNAEVSTSFSGNLVEQRSGASFINREAGSMRFLFFDDDTQTEQIAKFQEGSGMRNMYKLITTEDRKSVEVGKFQAAFWRRFVNNTFVKYDSVFTIPSSPGCRCTEIGTDKTFILISRQDIAQEAQSTTYVLFPYGETDQIL